MDAWNTRRLPLSSGDEVHRAVQAVRAAVRARGTAGFPRWTCIAVLLVADSLGAAERARWARQTGPAGVGSDGATVGARRAALALHRARELGEASSLAALAGRERIGVQVYHSFGADTTKGMMCQNVEERG